MQGSGTGQKNLIVKAVILLTLILKAISSHFTFSRREVTKLNLAFGNDCSGFRGVSGLEDQYCVETVRMLLPNACERLLAKVVTVGTEMDRRRRTRGILGKEGSTGLVVGEDPGHLLLSCTCRFLTKQGLT